MKKNKSYRFVKSFTLFFLSFFIATKAKAFSIMESIGGTCYSTGNCQMDDFIKIATEGIKFLLGLSGSIALLFFVYGGVVFLISGGSSEKVSQGKQILTGSIIGLIIVFTSYTIIGFVLSALGITNTADWFTSGRFK